MSIINLDRTKSHIVKWIKDYAKSAGIETLVVGLSGGIDSALVALLCKATGIYTICVAMPCHSSDFSLDRARNFAIEQNLKFVTVNLTPAYDSVFNQTKDLPVDGLTSRAATGGFRSCLRAPTLSYFALATKGLIIGTGNRSEDNLIRYFQKYGDGCVDISPIADLFKSEVYELFAYMTNISHSPLSELKSDINIKNTKSDIFVGPKASLNIFLSTPTADLWGEDGNQTDEEELGITYDEVEWADRQNMLNGIILSEKDPAKHRSWPGYTMRQRQVIAKVHQLEKISRHKHNPALPVCKVRNLEGLVK